MPARDRHVFRRPEASLSSTAGYRRICLAFGQTLGEDTMREADTPGANRVRQRSLRFAKGVSDSRVAVPRHTPYVK